jgi:hypothetical protein
MSPRALQRALIALAVLLALWAAVALFRGSLSDARATLDLPNLSPADVDRIEISAPSETLRIARADTAWTVNAHAADTREVSQLLTALADSAAASELVARSPGSHGRLGVDSAGRRLLVAHGERVLLELVIGSAGPSYQTAYVRRTDGDEVYLYRGRLVSLVDRPVDEWRDRRIGQLASDSVGSVRIARGTRVAALTRADTTWTVNGAHADSGTVQSLLSALRDLTAVGFATEARADSLDFVRPDRRLTVLGRRGDTLLALAFDSTTEGYFVRRGAGPVVYRLDFWRTDQLTPTEDALKRR